MALDAIDTAALADARADAVALLPDSCAVQRRTATSDKALGTKETWATIAGQNAVACLIRPYSKTKLGEVESRDGKRLAQLQWRVFLPVGTNVLVTDRVVVGARTLDVQIVHDLDDFALLLQVECIEVRQS